MLSTSGVAFCVLHRSGKKLRVAPELVEALLLATAPFDKLRAEGKKSEAEVLRFFDLKFWLRLCNWIVLVVNKNLHIRSLGQQIQHELEGVALMACISSTAHKPNCAPLPPIFYTTLVSVPAPGSFSHIPVASRFSRPSRPRRPLFGLPSSNQVTCEFCRNASRTTWRSLPVPLPWMMRTNGNPAEKA